MRSLFIDTSSFFMFLAIIEDDHILVSKQEEILTDMASKIVPTIDSLFQKVPFEIKDIDTIFVVNGPGSFTGVRVGVTVAKTIAWALKKKVIPISSLEFLATTPVSTKYCVPAIDARRGYVYAGVYDQELNVIVGNQYILLEKILPYLQDGTLVSRDHLEDSIEPSVDVLEIVHKHQNDAGVNPHELVPNYLKLTEAEENRLSKE